MRESYYDVLGVSPGATAAEVRAAYRRRSRELHPDRNPSPDANRRMALVNEAYAALSAPGRRTEPDGKHPRKPAHAAAPRAPVPAPREGKGSIQPDRLPDWYEFLDLRMNASSGEVVAALGVLGDEVRAAGYAPEDEERLRLQLRRAAEVLTNPQTRRVYDAALCGERPPAGQYLEFHTDLYSFLGVGRRAGVDRIAERVTELAGRLRRGSEAYREVAAAWRILRDPAARAEYDASLDEQP